MFLKRLRFAFEVFLDMFFEIGDAFLLLTYDLGGLRFFLDLDFLLRYT